MVASAYDAKYRPSPIPKIALEIVLGVLRTIHGELMKENYQMPNISCGEEGQVEEGQENGENEDPWILVMDDN